MGILSTNKKIINLGQGYSAGNGISIDDYVISYTGNEGQLYNAGPNIDIYEDQDQLYISGKDWSADIANASSNAYEQATALIPPEFDPSYISGVVDNKLDSTAFSTVSGDYATTSYVDMSDNLTYSRATAWGNQNLAPLNSVADNSAKWNEIEVYEQNSATYLTAHQDISNKLDTTAFSTVSGNFLTAHQVIPSAKWEDASDVVQSNSAQWSENTGDEEVNNAVYNNSANWNDITVYQTNSANYLTAHQDLSDYATTGDLNTASGILSGAIDYLSGNAGKTYTGISPIVVNNTTNEISADSQDITFGEGLDFTNGTLSVTAGGGGTTYTGDAQGALDEVYANSGVWLTAHQVIPSSKWEEASTEYEQNSATYLTAHQDISNKLDTTAFSTVSGNFLTAVDLTPYYTTADANTLSSMLSGAIDYVSANAGDEFPASANEAITSYQNASGTYLTAHQDISNKLDTTAFSDVSGTFLTAVNIPESANWNDATTAYQTNSGTYLTEPNLEYNAVGEISGYGNSAIAQYGAEKQWLQHDDTIVHVANSAQYAFGCNISALQRLMGIDETVLWSGSINISANPVITANESVQNFEKVEFIGKGYPSNYDTNFGTCFFNSQSTDSTLWLFGHAGGSNGGAIRFNQCRISASDNILAIEQTKQFNITGTATTTANTPALITKIIGIHRISG